jgi:pSer/pThr/pTyr-binding forkhead associated (FHA) protein
MTTTEFEMILLFGAGNRKGRQVAVPRLPFVIGRGPDCQLRPSSLEVSERHCSFHERNGLLLLTDFGSENGTYVNGVKIGKATAVGDGDEIAIGPLRFTLRIELPSPRKSSSVNDTAALASAREPTSLDRPPISEAQVKLKASVN